MHDDGIFLTKISHPLSSLIYQSTDADLKLSTLTCTAVIQTLDQTY